MKINKILCIVILIIMIVNNFAFAIAVKKSDKILIEKGSKIVEYENYGKFKNVGTKKYSYTIKDEEGLAIETGEGVYPYFLTSDDPRYEKLVKQKRIKHDVWDHVNTDDPNADFFKWSVAETITGNLPRDTEGIRQFFIAESLKNMGEFEQAIKAYYSVIVNFPGAACWSADGSFVWYVSTAALDRINILLREHPELGLRLEGVYLEIQNSTDTNLENDIVIVDPGAFITIGGGSGEVDLSELDVIDSRGEGAVRLIKYENGHWQLLVNDEPYIIKGITYSPTKVGTTTTEPGRETKWMLLDENQNGRCDAAYDSWVDVNGNNKQDANESVVGDFRLMRDMGINTIRTYHMLSRDKYLPEEFNKNVLRDLFRTYGIRVIMGDFFGAYGIGSGVKLDGTTDYRDPVQRENMKNNVRDMVLDHKDEPYVLAWILGNENDMPKTNTGVNYSGTNASDYPTAYATFLNEVAAMIHELDPNHPVITGNFSTNLLKSYNEYAPEVDIYGMNAYMGKDGFGRTWSKIKNEFDRPVIITEYGCDAYDDKDGVDEESQADYHLGCWKDIKYNVAGNMGEGNALGGVIFEWLDEWWKDTQNNNAEQQSTRANSALPFPDGWAHEEWFGVAGQGNGIYSPYLRVLRKTYYMYQDIWNK